MTNEERWKVAKFTRSTAINAQAEKILANRKRYEAVSKATGVPWDVIGVIHYRESSGDFAGVLHNGQKIIGTGKLTTLVPKGRGPFTSWEEAANDALVVCPPHAANNKDWSVAGTLDILERYNGLGYRNGPVSTVNGKKIKYPPQASPYLWAGTDQYVKGKYVADSKFDPEHVDKQLGTAAILRRLRDMEKPKTLPIDPIPHLGPKEPLPIDLPDDNEPLIPKQSWWQKIVAAFADFLLSLLPKGR